MPFTNHAFWPRYPLLRVLLPLITGIVIAEFLPLYPAALTWVIAMLLLTLAACLPWSKAHRVARLKSWLLLCIWLLSGSIIHHLQYKLPAAKASTAAQVSSDFYIGTITEASQKRKNSYRAVAELGWMRQHAKWIPTSGKTWLYAPKQEKHVLKPGTKILLTKKPALIPNNANPGSFNFKTYSERQQIYYSIYLTDKDYRILQEPSSNSFSFLLYQCQQYVLQQLNQYISSKESLGIAQALLIGYRAELDIEVLQAYSDTGLVHIIAISGMHLGMIYGLCVILFAWMDKLHLRWLKTILILCIIWGFTLITGAGPSITRAAVMFSCLQLGNLLQRNTEPINNLAAAALLLLLYDPAMLYDIGFQLSFAAVLSIMLFYPRIFRWFWCRNHLIKYLWSLIAVTISAQILTTPIAIYHFHQFPNYFLFANLMAIPVSGIILYAEIALIMLAKWPIIATPLGNMIDVSIQWMNRITEQIAILPGALTEHIQLSLPMLVLIYGGIAFTTVWLIVKQARFFVMAIACFGILSINQSISTHNRKKQFQLIVCNLPKTGVAIVTEGTYFGLIGDSTVWKDPFLYQQYIKPIRTHFQVIPGKLTYTRWEHNLLSSSRKSVLFLHQGKLQKPPASPKQVDALIITGNPKLYIKDIVQVFNPEVIVFDSSNPQWKINYWKKDCDKLHLRHHSVPEKGAFVMDL